MSLETLLSRQAGVISREQALARGMSRDAVDHRLRTRRWRPLHPRVYLVDGHRYDDEARIRAAVLWAGEGAVLSGTAAAWWHGMVDEAPATVGVTVRRRRCPRPRPGVDLRRRALAPVDVLRRRGLLVTAPPLAVLEAAVELGGSRGGALLDRALQRWVAFPEVRHAYRRGLGAQGSTAAGHALAAAAHRSAAVAERLLVRLLCDAGMTGWGCGPANSTVAFPGARVAVAVSGWAQRMDGADERRADALQRTGWTLLRYTWTDLTGRPAAVLAEISREVAAGSCRADRLP